MKTYFRPLLSLLILAICGLLGGWIYRDAGSSQVRSSWSERAGSQAHGKVPAQVSRRVRDIARDEFRDGTTVEIFASMKFGEVILRFPTDAADDSFLDAIEGSEVRLESQLDRLRAVRVGYGEWSDLAGLLGRERIVAYDSLPAVPAPAPVGASGQAGLVGFGDGLLPWLGIHSDNSQWGAGVIVAVLDSGVVPHPALAALADSIAMTPFPADLDKTNGHGTAVASLIAGSDPAAPGIAPAVKLISIRVGDESGKADSFALAAGILSAIDSGAQIINCSMGTTENNPLIEDAVNYARDRKVLIVAASGNSEQADACYPAAYPSVFSVGAVDARGEHLDFSNYGTYLSVTAPGYAVNAAWPGGRYRRISGTSASAPIVTGAIAATMSSGRGVTMSASQAAEIVMNYSNEAGIPGPDSQYGVGILDVGRIMNRNIPGIVDAAITNQRLVKSNDSGAHYEVQVTIQNRGTAMLVNTLVEIGTSFGSRQFNATTMMPGGIETFSMPVHLAGLPAGEPVQVSSALTLGTAGLDMTPNNNRRSDLLFRD